MISCSQQPATGLYPLPDESTPHCLTPFFIELPFKATYPFHLCLVLSSVLFLSRLATNIFIQIACVHAACLAHFILIMFGSVY
jgi:hypothetical protein